MSAPTVEKPKVTRFRVTDDAGFYMVGDMTFDEVDRDLAYIDRQIATFLAWRGWVMEHGERKSQTPVVE